MDAKRNGNRNFGKKQAQSNGNGVKSRLNKSFKNKPKIDLRDVLEKKNKTTKTATAKPTTKIIERLGLQSKAARLEALKQARAIRNGEKTSKENTTKSALKKTPNSVLPARLAPKTSLKSRESERERRRIDPPRKVNDKYSTENSRRELRRRDDPRDISSKGVHVPIIIPQVIPQTAIPTVSLVPSSYEQKNIYGRHSPTSISSQSTQTGNSVLISNLSSSITENEIAELFGDIGPLMNLQMINPTTALVTYFASTHALKACQVYNYRLLDGFPMNCTIVPSPNTSNSISSSRFYPQRVSSGGRLYSDQMVSSASKKKYTFFN